MHTVELYFVLEEHRWEGGKYIYVPIDEKPLVSLFDVETLRERDFQGNVFYYGRRIGGLDDAMGGSKESNLLLVLLLVLAVADSDMTGVVIPFAEDEGGIRDDYKVWDDMVIFHSDFGGWDGGKRLPPQKMKMNRRQVVEDLRVQFENLHGFSKTKAEMNHRKVFRDFRSSYEMYLRRIDRKATMKQLLESFLDTDLGLGVPGGNLPNPYPEALRKLVEMSQSYRRR